MLSFDTLNFCWMRSCCVTCRPLLIAPSLLGLKERKSLPSDTAEILRLQSRTGQWRLCESLYRSLGHSSTTIPIAPPGVKDWRWATALAIIYLRRRPALIDDTFDAYRPVSG